MDLNTLFAVGTATIEIKHPVTGDVLMDESATPKPMTLTVMGKHTKEYKKLERKIAFLALKRNKKLNIEEMSVEEFESALSENEGAQLDLHASLVTGCNIFMEGKKLKYSYENILAMLSDERCSWINDQLTEELEKADLFFKS